MPEVNKVHYHGDRPYEISIEVSEQTLRKYGLTMSEISQAIRNSSVDMPGGTIKSEGGDILLRTKGQVYTGSEFGQLVLRTFPDGTRLTLGDIATIKTALSRRRLRSLRWRAHCDLAGCGRRSAERNRDGSACKEYVAKKRQLAGRRSDGYLDRSSKYLEGRLDDDGQHGVGRDSGVYCPVAVPAHEGRVLGHRRSADSFLGALWLMPTWPVTINTISLFGFIIVLGIVVDDAIIIGESIYTKIRADGHTLDNVIQGAHRVAIPATFGVLTTIAAFAPMMFIGGVVGPFFEAMAFVVILCLFFSLVESKLILPAHLVQRQYSADR